MVCCCLPARARQIVGGAFNTWKKRYARVLPGCLEVYKKQYDVKVGDTSERERSRSTIFELLKTHTHTHHAHTHTHTHHAHTHTHHTHHTNKNNLL